MGVMWSNAVASVSLSAIRNNIAALRERAGGRAVMLPVKANAYGHGLVEVARAAEQGAWAEWLAVATVDEGIAIRTGGVRLPVLKFSHPFRTDEAQAAVRHGLSVAVVDAASIELVAQAARDEGIEAAVHLKLDTGMGRIGAPPESAVALGQLIDATQGVRLDGIFTHLPVADDPARNDVTTAALDRFDVAVNRVTQARGAVPWMHSANSGAIITGLARGNLVRPGIAAYGYFPDAATPRAVELRPAMTITTQVSFIKQVSAGTTVGYGRTWTAATDTWIASIPIGYGDGFSRHNSNSGRVLIDGRSYPVAGRVCMDQTMIDLGPKPPSIRVGDEVVLLGTSGTERIDADELAARSHTISYEVLTQVSARVERRYVD